VCHAQNRAASGRQRGGAGWCTSDLEGCGWRWGVDCVLGWSSSDWASGAINRCFPVTARSRARVACRIVRRDGQTKYRPRAPRTRCRRRCPMKATACNGNDHRCWTWPSPFTQLRPQCSVRPSLKIFIYILVLSCLQPSSLRGLAALRMILLHSFLSSVDCSNWSCFNHVHFLMLSSQYILGLPRLRWPGINEHLIMVINEDIC